MGPLTIDWALVVWTLLTFAGLFALLARFTFKPLRRILDEREARIRSSLEQADQAREEARRLLAENEARLAEAREETRRIVAAGHTIVADMKRQSQESARQEAEALVRQARTEIDRELRRSLDELRGTVTNLSIRIARQVIRDAVDEQRHAELADDFIERLKKTHAGRQS